MDSPLKSSLKSYFNGAAALGFIFAIQISLGLAGEKQTPDPPLELEVVSFNIRYLNKGEKGRNHWSQRKDLVAAAMKEFKADIFGVQEALHQQLEYLSTSVSGYTRFGIGRDDGKTRGEYSPILFRSDRFELDSEDSGTFWLSDTPDKIGSMTWGNEIPRICTWARLTETRSKRSFYVFNTHWDHKSQESRLAAAKLITARIKTRKNPDEPVILLGDFNAGKTNPAIQHIAGSLEDSFAIANPDAPDTGTFHGFRGSKTGQKIDHIFVPPGTIVNSAAVLYFNRDGAYPSDHYPVRAALQFR